MSSQNLTNPTYEVAQIIGTQLLKTKPFLDRPFHTFSKKVQISKGREKAEDGQELFTVGGQ